VQVETGSIGNIAGHKDLAESPQGCVGMAIGDGQLCMERKRVGLHPPLYEHTESDVKDYQGDAQNELANSQRVLQ
jgi:hypothetical protein